MRQLLWSYEAMTSRQNIWISWIPLFGCTLFHIKEDCTSDDLTNTKTERKRRRRKNKKMKWKVEEILSNGSPSPSDPGRFTWFWQKCDDKNIKARNPQCRTPPYNIGVTSPTPAPPPCPSQLLSGATLPPPLLLVAPTNHKLHLQCNPI